MSAARVSAQVDAVDPWHPYLADASMPWNRTRVLHLHRRLGFSPAWGYQDRDLRDGPEVAIERFFAASVDPAFERLSARMAALAVRANTPDDVGPLRGWWTHRMLRGPDQLTERLTLFWHDYFATSQAVVRDLGAMRAQNEVFRRMGRGPFEPLLAEMIRDPALMTWLDATSSRASHPNENLARELLELFSLGVGHYDERDVREMARALTGRAVHQGRFRRVDEWRDRGEKTILGEAGPWDDSQISRVLAGHPATTRRLADRLCDWLFGEVSLPIDALDGLVQQLERPRAALDVATRTVVASHRFFAASSLRRRVLTPIEFVVGVAQALELADRGVTSGALADWASRMGMNLFHPPDVAGYRRGREWLDARTATVRMNFVAALLAGELDEGAEAFDALALARRHGHAASTADVARFYVRLWLGADGASVAAWCRNMAVRHGASPTVDGCRAVLLAVLTLPQAHIA